MKLGWENEKSIGGYDGGKVGDGVGVGVGVGAGNGRGRWGVGSISGFGGDESWEWREVGGGGGWEGGD